jgi:pyridoxamine 5'-phosphate oxidase
VSEPLGPIAQLRRWIEEARTVEGNWSDALSLATATPDGRPSVRAVMLRAFDDRGLVFFTDEGSRKGTQLATNPVAAAVFLWPVRGREARIEGPVTRLPDDEADAIFAERPPDRRLPLWAWRQDDVVAQAADLRRRLDQVTTELGPVAVPRPPYWVGYRLQFETIEFWQERPEGLHERLAHRQVDGRWVAQRLAP